MGMGDHCLYTQINGQKVSVENSLTSKTCVNDDKPDVSSLARANLNSSGSNDKKQRAIVALGQALLRYV